MWSVGTLAAFMALGHEPFQGRKRDALLASVASHTELADGVVQLTGRAAPLPSHGVSRVTFASRIAAVASPAFADLCAQLLTVAPATRLSAERALAHAAVRNDEAVRRLGASVDNDACSLAYEVQDTCIRPFARTFAPVLSRLLPPE
eukprot:TRINITY_DN2856_c0_g1_i1.p3 TRINITY_DN2856_c0_g1~~TRINITY_DN2856_c0_g1_i1.p3  ORF type:complete len:147 (-),score=97.34 TRINITY_DN2856_c0_g1_i1:43-483(-)